MVDERLAIETLRTLGTERGLERREAATHPPTGASVHEFGTQDTTRFCRSCSCPTQWMCFTCHKHLCAACIQNHAGTRNAQYVGHKGAPGMAPETPPEPHPCATVRVGGDRPPGPWRRVRAWLAGAFTAQLEPTVPFVQLSLDAQRRAVRTVQNKLGGEWWDEDDEADVRDAMILALAERLGTPDYLADSGEVHGIPGVAVDEWVFDYPTSLWVNGPLTRETAPRLPWCEGISSVELVARRSEGTIVHLVAADTACTCGSDVRATVHDVNCLTLLPSTADPEQRFRLGEAARHAMVAAWEAGKEERDRKTGEEHAAYVAEDHLFTKTGENVSDLPA